ncbi:hypothetical protein RRG08_053635 [Elysia crispata]|uniref:Uncharacterized protein n=1 Tax=Elysia crispata TaxID=231223 RepID=A0AAE0ZGL5_9GAST|nr:hypothetical protein RRG08_053635 [Elysia crispata]
MTVSRIASGTTCWEAQIICFYHCLDRQRHDFARSDDCLRIARRHDLPDQMTVEIASGTTCLVIRSLFRSPVARLARSDDCFRIARARLA